MAGFNGWVMDGNSGIDTVLIGIMTYTVHFRGTHHLILALNSFISKTGTHPRLVPSGSQFSVVSFFSPDAVIYE